MSGICPECGGSGRVARHANTIVGPDDMPETVKIVQEPEKTVGQARERRLTKALEEQQRSLFVRVGRYVRHYVGDWELATKLFVVFCVLTICFVVGCYFKYGISGIPGP